MKKVYYIETTLNGYLIKKIEISNYISNKDYVEELTFNRDGEDVDYYNDITGDWDDLDEFLKHGSNNQCENYDYNKGDKPHVYMEHWLTDTLGYYTDRYIGLMIR